MLNSLPLPRFGLLSSVVAVQPGSAALASPFEQSGTAMNGYVRLETADGDFVVVNVDRVRFVRRFRGENGISAINFEKGNYLVVKGSLDSVMTILADG